MHLQYSAVIRPISRANVCARARARACALSSPDWHQRAAACDPCVAWHTSFKCVTCLIHTYDMPHSHVWHASFTCVICLIHMCDVTSHVTRLASAHNRARSMRGIPHSHVWHASFTCVPWLIHMCAMTHSHVCHDMCQCMYNTYI